MADVTISRPFKEPIDARVSDAQADSDALRAKADEVAKGGARAAVLGVNDGLVSNLCLILGVAGASASRASVRLAGFASLVAGAFSMAAGEWISVRAQVDLYKGVLAELRRLVRRNPRLVLDELAAHLEDSGFERSTARQAAAELPLDEQQFLSFSARTVFGVNTDQLGSPLTAALSSFVFFAAGALVPLLPWFFYGGTPAVLTSSVLTALAGMVVGAVVAALSSEPRVRGAVRQVAIIVAASTVTYLVGKAFGTTVG
jgi:VIT1/CCC1 family predicted Fe2+/Mn2+ transporter